MGMQNQTTSTPSAIQKKLLPSVNWRWNAKPRLLSEQARPQSVNTILSFVVLFMCSS